MCLSKNRVLPAQGGPTNSIISLLSGADDPVPDSAWLHRSSFTDPKFSFPLGLPRISGVEVGVYRGSEQGQYDPH
jgi:hypothetical protein